MVQCESYLKQKLIRIVFIRSTVATRYGLMNNIDYVSLEKKVVSEDKAGSGRSQVVWLERKSVSLMKNQVIKFSRTGQDVPGW